LKRSLTESQAELKSLLLGLDKVLLEKAIELARRWYKAIVEKLDELIKKLRDKRLSIEHLRVTWYETCLGPVRVKRRQYRDKDGQYRYLLDELLGMGRDHTVASVREIALELASKMSYRGSAEVLRRTSAIDLSHQTIWRLLARVADPYLKKAELELRDFLETGEIPEGEGRELARLLVEADGVMLSLQRERERRAEVKVGIAYEGWSEVSRDRYRTVNKTIFAEVAGWQEYWAGMSLKLQKRYELSKVGEIIVGGDGARWIKEGVEYLGGRFQLDRYHLNRELCSALGKEGETRRKVREACDKGQVELGLGILSEAMKKAQGEQARRLRKACGYLSENSSGLGDYRQELGEEGKTLRRTGAIEGNVDKLVVRRMKNQGMNWTIRGIRRLLCVRFLVLEGKLREWLHQGDNGRSKSILSRRRVRPVIDKTLKENPGDWLDVQLPALQGPHASRPWAQVLKALAEVTA
jgi:hypothetical protein